MELSFILALLGLSPFAIAVSSGDCTFDQISPSTTLTWCPCYNGFFCARLDVPLDYQYPNINRASVPLVKYPAQINSSDSPYQGMILLNPGGPGASGVSMALNNGSLIQYIAGTNWDIVGFDTRGIGLSVPNAGCSVNTSSIQNATLKMRDVPRVSDDYYNAYIAFGKELGKNCQKAIGGQNQAGPHMSTAITARDMLSIVDAFAATAEGKTTAKPSNLLNYYGVSYGTFLGQTFASMFPSRVGNMVLDGVVSPEAYLNDYTSNSVNNMDGVIAAFFIYCHRAGPLKCSYYAGSTPKDIYKRFIHSFVQLTPRKAEVENLANATVLESALLTLKVALLTAADGPLSGFTMLALILLDLEKSLSTQDIAGWVKRAQAVVGIPTPASDENASWRLGALCSDSGNYFYNQTLGDLRPQLAAAGNESIIGEIWSVSILGCTGWSIKANERFAGPFGGDTATPILFVGNTYDSVTPHQNAISSAPKYKNAEVLTIDAMGHGTSATGNTCGYAKIGAYFRASIMPGNDSYCPLETGPFGLLLNGTLTENIERAGLADLVH